MDVLSPEQRSYNMSRIRGRDTKPEFVVRKWLWANGYRYRLYRKDLPSRPDIVLPRYRTAVFIDGCFWHHHQNCHYATIPATRTEWWIEKFRKTAERDRNAVQKLENAGWKVITIWECEIKNGQYEQILRNWFCKTETEAYNLVMH